MTKQRRPTLTFPADVRQADPRINEDAELLILDYVTEDALRTALRSSDAGARGVKRGINGQVKSNHSTNETRDKLRIVDQFLRIYQKHHPSSQPIPQPQHFRLALLRFTTLLLRVSSPNPSIEPPITLTNLRRTNRERASTWWTRRRRAYPLPSSTDTTIEDPADTLATALNRIDRATDSGSTDRDNEGAEPSLLDLLPMFFELTAERARFQRCEYVTSEIWLDLACEFMTQAFLEQRVRFEARGCSALLEAFAWGPLPEKDISDGRDAGDSRKDAKAEVEDTGTIHDIFLLPDDNRSSPTSNASDATDSITTSHYTSLRNRALKHLDPRTCERDHTPISSTDLTAYYKTLVGANGSESRRGTNRKSAAHPRKRFEDELLRFLRGLQDSVDVPILKQLEDAQIGRRTTVDWERKRVGIEETEWLRRVWARGVGCDGIEM